MDEILPIESTKKRMFHFISIHCYLRFLVGRAGYSPSFKERIYKYIYICWYDWGWFGAIGMSFHTFRVIEPEDMAFEFFCQGMTFHMLPHAFTSRGGSTGLLESFLPLLKGCIPFVAVSKSSDCKHPIYKHPLFNFQRNCRFTIFLLEPSKWTAGTQSQNQVLEAKFWYVFHHVSLIFSGEVY